MKGGMKERAEGGELQGGSEGELNEEEFERGSCNKFSKSRLHLEYLMLKKITGKYIKFIFFYPGPGGTYRPVIWAFPSLEFIASYTVDLCHEKIE
jgi:hypothetical protein